MDLIQLVFTSTAICQRPPCSQQPFVQRSTLSEEWKELLPVLAHSLWHITEAGVFCQLDFNVLLWLSGQYQLGFHCSLRKPRQTGKANSTVWWWWGGWGDHCMRLNVSSSRVMSGEQGWLLPPSVPVFNVWRGRKTDWGRRRKKERDGIFLAWESVCQSSARMFSVEFDQITSE